MKKRLLKRLLRLALSNVWLKIGSLVVAVLIWYSLSSQGMSDRTFNNLPYEIRNIPMHLEVVDRGIGAVSVTVRGPQNMITYLKPENITIPMDLPDDVKTGELTMDLHPWNIRTPYPNQLSILQVFPETITLRIEEVIQKSIPIHPLLRGTLSSGYEINKWEIFPGNATIKGPSSTVSRIDRLFTESIDITGVNMTFNERVELTPPEQLVSIIEPARVTVHLEIKEKIIERSFPEFDISIVKPDPDPGIKISPTSITVNVTGPYRVVTALQLQDIIVAANCKDLDPGHHNIPLILVEAPIEIRSVSMDPPTAEVWIPKSTPEKPEHPGTHDGGEDHGHK